MGFILGFKSRSLKASLCRATVERLLYGVILLVVGFGLIVATTSNQPFLPLSDGVGNLLNHAVSRIVRFFIGAFFIIAAMVIFALVNETEGSESDAAASSYSGYSWNT